MNNEEWKDIDGYGGVYRISSMGRIMSVSRYKINRWGSPTLLPQVIMRPKPTPQGYMQVGLRNPKQKLFYVHRLVASAFIDNPLGFNQVNHKDGDKTNNRSENLEWCSASHNIRHAVESGLNNGAPGKTVNICEEKARSILSSAGSDASIARFHGVSRITVSNIRKRITWSHLDALAS